MTNTKIGNLVEVVSNIVENDGVEEIKSYIGDSTSNNRSLSVRQLIRYFQATNDQITAQNLEIAYSVLRRTILRRRNARTDAVDLSEFFQAATSANVKVRRKLGKLLSNAV